LAFVFVIFKKLWQNIKNNEIFTILYIAKHAHSIRLSSTNVKNQKERKKTALARKDEGKLKCT